MCPQCKKKLRAARSEQPLPTAPRPNFETRLQQIAANAEPYAFHEVRPVTRKVRPALAGFTIAALVGIAITLVWLFVAHAHRADVAHKLLIAPQSANLDAARNADDEVQNASAVYLLLLVVAGVLFIAWLYHLTKVIEQHSPNSLRHRAGWAIGGWFVPILNLVRPKQMVDDVWSGSSSDWSSKGPAFYVHLWWAVFLISGFIARFAALKGTDTLDQVESADRFSRWADGLELVAVALAILVVVTTTQRVLRAVRPA